MARKQATQNNGHPAGANRATTGESGLPAGAEGSGLSRMSVTTTSLDDDYLSGIEAIAEFLGNAWNPRKVRYARETKALPIRMKPGIGIYAFKSELLAALRLPDSLPGAGGGGA